ncbi:Uncharacterised protein g5194 [Pycnogonum litorale]
MPRHLNFQQFQKKAKYDHLSSSSSAERKHEDVVSPSSPPKSPLESPSSAIMKPLAAALAIPGMYLVYKYNQFKRQQQETNKRKITERELTHLNHKIDKLLTRLDEHDPELATSQEDECVICCSAKATMQTYPCAHRVVCRRCFVKTIQLAVSQRMLPLRCVICRTKILRLKQSTSYYFRNAVPSVSSSPSPNSPISPTYIFNQHQQLANLSDFSSQQTRKDKHTTTAQVYCNQQTDVGAEDKKPVPRPRPKHLQLQDDYGYALLREKIKVCSEEELSSCSNNRPFYVEGSKHSPSYDLIKDGLTLYATRQRRNYVLYRRKYKSVASKAANLPPIAELESPSHSYTTVSNTKSCYKISSRSKECNFDDEITYRSDSDDDSEGVEIEDDAENEDEDVMSSSASTPLVSNYKKRFMPSFLRLKTARLFFKGQK